MNALKLLTQVIAHMAMSQLARTSEYPTPCVTVFCSRCQSRVIPTVEPTHFSLRLTSNDQQNTIAELGGVYCDDVYGYDRGSWRDRSRIEPGNSS
jgi:hypothetical protein